MSLMRQDFLTPEQLAKKLQLSLTTIYNLIKSGDVPSIRVGKCYRIPQDDLEVRLGTRNTPQIPPVVSTYIAQLHQLPFHTKIRQVVLFGSYARGLAHADSDIDLLVTTDPLSANERRGLIRCEESATKAHEYLDELQVMKMPHEQWNDLIKHDAAIARTILKEGIALW